MSAKPVLVNGSYKDAGFILTAVFAGVFVVLVLVCQLAGAPDEVGYVLGGFALVFALLAFFLYQRITARRLTVLSTADGFVTFDRGGEREYFDADATDIATAFTRRYSNGVLKGYTRKATIEVEVDGVRRDLVFQYPTNLNEADPLGDLFERLVNRLAGVAREDLDAGRPVAGDGWQLDRQGLRVGDGADAEPYPYDTLAASGVVDDKVCVWERGKAHASVKIPSSGRNAFLLAMMLGERISKRADADKPDVTEDGLGRIIFERDKSVGTAKMVAFVIFGIVLIGVGASMLFSGVNGGLGVGKLWVVAIGAPVGGIALVVYAVTNRVNVFRCHELGVARINPRGRKELKYGEVGEFTFAAVRQYHNGAYTGTTMTLTFTPRVEADADAITYKTTVKGDDAEVENLRDFVANVLSARMLADVQAGRSVPWTPLATFQPDGLEVRPKKKRAGEPRLVPYGELTNFGFKDGWLTLWGRGDKPVLQEITSAGNFFPGFALLNTIMSAVKKGSAPPTPADGEFPPDE